MARKRISARKLRAIKICNASLGKGRSKAKFERCVRKVKKTAKPRRPR